MSFQDYSGSEYSYQNNPNYPENYSEETSNAGYSDKNKIIVYILTANPKSKEVELLALTFSNSMFYVKPINIPAPVEIQGSGNISLASELEAYRVSKVLKEASIEYPDSYVIVIKDTSMTNSSGDDVAKIVGTVLDESGWDLCYLCRWLDRCDLYRNTKKIEGKTSVLTRTFSPNGVQAILFSPNGRDIVTGDKMMNDGHTFLPVVNPLGTQLSQEIGKGNLTAYCVVPNLYEFNVFDSDNVSDLAKLSECRRPESNSESQNILPFTWFIIIVLGVILLAWAFWYLGPKYDSFV